MKVQGTFFDGRTLRATPVTLAVREGRTLHLQGPDLEASYDLSALRLSDRLGHLPRYLYLPGDATVECPDDATLDHAFATLHPARAHARLIHFLESHSAIATVAAVLLVLFTAGIFHFGLPVLTRHTAARTPASIDRKAGEIALATFDARFAPSSLAPTQHARVQEQLARLLPEHAATARPHLVFRSLGPGNANAFALPGNIIIVADELVLLATDDELAAVLAHELGHLEHRHGLQSILQSSLALLVVTAITGDLSTLTTFSATLPLVILTQGYSRDFEREADAHAHALLLHRQIRLKNFATILTKITGERPAKATKLNYLSTHPATDDRIRLFQPHPDPAPSPAATQDPTPAKLPATPPATTTASPGKTKFPTNIKALPELSTTGNPRGESDFAFLPYANPIPPRAVVELRRAYDLPKHQTPPVVIHQTPTVYPTGMRRLNREGDALVDFIVDRGGDVRAAYVVRATNTAFAEAALHAVEQWKFTPARRHGEAVNAHVQLPVKFTIGDSPATATP